MKKIIMLASCMFGLLALSYAQQPTIKPAKAGVNYGKSITNKNVISVKSLENNLAQNGSFLGKFEGKVLKVCKMKGCYLTLQAADNAEPITVRFTDYAFFVPQDLVGKTVIVEGRAKQKDPQAEISVTADGVLVVK